MKNLITTIPVNKNSIEDPLTKTDLAGYDINVSRGEVLTVDGVRLFQPEVAWINFEVPETALKSLSERGLSKFGITPIARDLRQAAKKYLTENIG